jgi:hypothetical protein
MPSSRSASAEMISAFLPPVSAHSSRSGRCVRHPRFPDGGRQLFSHEGCLQRRLEEHGIAGEERGEHARERDRQREVPRGGDDHDPAGAGHDRRISFQRFGLPQIVFGKVDRLGHLGIGFARALACIQQHRRNQRGPAPAQHPGHRSHALHALRNGRVAEGRSCAFGRRNRGFDLAGLSQLAAVRH